MNQREDTTQQLPIGTMTNRRRVTVPATTVTQQPQQMSVQEIRARMPETLASIRRFWEEEEKSEDEVELPATTIADQAAFQTLYQQEWWGLTWKEIKPSVMDLCKDPALRKEIQTLVVQFRNYVKPIAGRYWDGKVLGFINQNKRTQKTLEMERTKIKKAVTSCFYVGITAKEMKILLQDNGLDRELVTVHYDSIRKLVASLHKKANTIDEEEKAPPSTISLQGQLDLAETKLLQEQINHRGTKDKSVMWRDSYFSLEKMKRKHASSEKALKELEAQRLTDLKLNQLLQEQKHSIFADGLSKPYLTLYPWIRESKLKSIASYKQMLASPFESLEILAAYFQREQLSWTEHLKIMFIKGIDSFLRHLYQMRDYIMKGYRSPVDRASSLFFKQGLCAALPKSDGLQVVYDFCKSQLAVTLLDKRYYWYFIAYVDLLREPLDYKKIEFQQIQSAFDYCVFAAENFEICSTVSHGYCQHTPLPVDYIDMSDTKMELLVQLNKQMEENDALTNELKAARQSLQSYHATNVQQEQLITTLRAESRRLNNQLGPMQINAQLTEDRLSAARSTNGQLVQLYQTLKSSIPGRIAAHMVDNVEQILNYDTFDCSITYQNDQLDCLVKQDRQIVFQRLTAEDFVTEDPSKSLECHKGDTCLTAAGTGKIFAVGDLCFKTSLECCNCQDPYILCKGCAITVAMAYTKCTKCISYFKWEQIPVEDENEEESEDDEESGNEGDEENDEGNDSSLMIIT